MNIKAFPTCQSYKFLLTLLVIIYNLLFHCYYLIARKCTCDCDHEAKKLNLNLVFVYGKDCIQAFDCVKVFMNIFRFPKRITKIIFSYQLL
jgi:hypothetical protein